MKYFRDFLYGVLIAVSSASIQADEVTRDFVFRHEHVLGTSFELRLNSASTETAKSAEQAALAEIDRLSKILSRHHTDSELVRWQKGPVSNPQAISEDLAQVLLDAEHWRKQTEGAFDVRYAKRPAVEDLTEGENSELNSSPYTLSRKEEGVFIQRNDSLPISLDGLGKGYIIDRVSEVLRDRYPSIESFSVNIGGDLRKVGNSLLPIAITNPSDPSEGALPISSFVASQSMAIATSGTYRRFTLVNGAASSHIVDPRNGLPTNKIASATVVATNTVDADALATALCVMPPEDGITLVESLKNVECLIVLANGEQMSSLDWQGVAVEPAYSLVSGEESGAGKSGLTVNFTLNRPKDGRYRRPYVAIWLEDADRFPVKTALLWMQTESPGPRWHRDLTRWYRNDRTRKLVEESDLIGTISSATRGPGEYSTRFDGLDNSGEPLPDGEYTLCLEVAREHGTYQIIRETVVLGAEPIPRTELEGNVEMSAVSYHYIPVNESEVASTQEKLEAVVASAISSTP